MFLYLFGWNYILFRVSKNVLTCPDTFERILMDIYGLRKTVLESHTHLSCFLTLWRPHCHWGQCTEMGQVCSGSPIIAPLKITLALTSLLSMNLIFCSFIFPAWIFICHNVIIGAWCFRLLRVNNETVPTSHQALCISPQCKIRLNPNPGFPLDTPTRTQEKFLRDSHDITKYTINAPHSTSPFNCDV